MGFLLPGISVTAPWAFNWFSDENGNTVLIQIIALGVYLESISIDADMAIQGQYKYAIGSYSNCATLDELIEHGRQIHNVLPSTNVFNRRHVKHGYYNYRLTPQHNAGVFITITLF